VATAPAPAPAPTGAADERCNLPCRFLADTPLADMSAKVQAACNGPWGDAVATNDCAEIDFQRNCIYATAGYTFKKKRYSSIFKSESWYKARADFKDADLSAVATANVAALKAAAKACKKTVALDPPDQKAVDAFLAAIEAGKPDVPSIIDGYEEDNMSKAQMTEFFQGGARKVYIRKNLLSARYQVPMSPSTDAATTRAKVVSLEFHDPSTDNCPEDEECGGYGGIDLALDASGKVVGMSIMLSACPFVYRVDGDREVLHGELVRNLAGAQREATQYLPITIPSCEGRVTFRVREEKDEVTYLDELALVVDGVAIRPDACAGALCVNDGHPLVMKRGESVDVAFTIPAGSRCERVGLRSNGYYVPVAP
jgi:hypothetical protein